MKKLFTLLLIAIHVSSLFSLELKETLGYPEEPKDTSVICAIPFSTDRTFESVGFFTAETIDDEASVSHETFKISKPLINCYPNPFSESASLDISVRKPGYVNILIYDLKGRIHHRINKIFVEDKLTGIDITGILNKGIYYCTIESNYFTDTILIIKQ